MSTVAVAQGVRRDSSRSAWLRDFLKEELAPYPGRAGTVARMAVATTLVMIICMTFRVPYGFQGAVYALSTVTFYGAATVFAIMISVGIPFGDRPVSAETNVEDTLWVVLAASIGVVVTAVVELAYGRVKPGDDIVLPIAERLAAVQAVLACYAEDRPVEGATERTITRL